jgi:predicted DCC family thiol-disulfide oxidoreductase YuxK
MKKIIITLIFLFSFIPFINAKEVEIYLFYSNSCPHCANEKEFLSTLEDIKVKKYE